MWDRLNTHVSHATRELIDKRDWLTVFLLSAYSPNLNPLEGVWAHIKHNLGTIPAAGSSLLTHHEITSSGRQPGRAGGGAP
ncbi:transposase [Streptomyces sp. NPDC021470]|uniref:transposase n=1 Tax=Streptomyces sp. NPDC021470 TaxID=3154902 RepID=UPI0033CD694F